MDDKQTAEGNLEPRSMDYVEILSLSLVDLVKLAMA